MPADAHPTLVPFPAGTSLGSSHLFFGCRHRQHDYIYEEELAAATAGGALGVLHVAFSRDTGAKDYVQASGCNAHPDSVAMHRCVAWRPQHAALDLAD